jgi:hypothetical protein
MYTTLQDKKTTITEEKMEIICFASCEKMKDWGETEEKWEKKDNEAEERKNTSLQHGSIKMMKIP